MKKLMMGIFALVMCLSSFKGNAQLSRFLNEEQINQINSTIDRDEKGRVIGFDYGNIYEEIGRAKFISVLFELTGSKLLLFNSKECEGSGYYKYNSETGVSSGVTESEAADELELAGDDLKPHAEREAKNWRRPGCKPRNRAICIIWY